MQHNVDHLTSLLDRKIQVLISNLGQIQKSNFQREDEAFQRLDVIKKLNEEIKVTDTETREISHNLKNGLNQAKENHKAFIQEELQERDQLSMIVD
jgi:hypothetical protein